jgi:hypothetical protein
MVWQEEEQVTTLVPKLKFGNEIFSLVPKLRFGNALAAALFLFGALK